MRDLANRLHCGFRRQAPGLDLPYHPHRRGDAIHIHAGRISRDVGDDNGVLAVRPKLQLTPARQDLRAQADCAREAIRRGDHLIRGLPVDEQCPRERKDKIAAYIGCHGTFSPRMFARILRMEPARSFAPAPSGSSGRAHRFADRFELATIKTRVRPVLIYWRGLWGRTEVARAVALPPLKPGFSTQSGHCARESK